MRARLVLSALLTLGAVPAAPATLARAQAQPTPAPLVHLQWDRPPGSTCIAQQALAQRVEALLGRDAFVAEDRADLRIDGTIEWRSGGWIATLRIVGRNAGIRGIRQVRQQAGDCAALNPVLTVVLATLIDVARTESPPDGGLAFAVGAAGAFDLGALPKPAAGGSLWLGVMPSAAWSIWIDASAWLPVTKLDAPERGASYSAWQAGLALCREFRASERLAFAACVGGQLGALEGEGRGLGINRSSQLLLAQSSLEAVLSVRLFSMVFLRASTGGELALSRPTFYVEQPDGARSDVFRPPLFGLLARLGIVLATRGEHEIARR